MIKWKIFSLLTRYFDDIELKMIEFLNNQIKNQKSAGQKHRLWCSERLWLIRRSNSIHISGANGTAYISKIELGICYSMILLENVIYRLLISLIINKKNDFSCSDPVCASNMKKIDQKLMIFDGLQCVEPIYEISGANAMILRENQSESVSLLSVSHCRTCINVYLIFWLDISVGKSHIFKSFWEVDNRIMKNRYER